jgi:hypothetical protein
VAVPVVAVLCVLPAAAPLWLKLAASAAAAAFGAFTKGLVEGMRRARRYDGLKLPPEVKEEKQPMLGHTLVVSGRQLRMSRCIPSH